MKIGLGINPNETELVLFTNEYIPTSLSSFKFIEKFTLHYITKFWKNSIFIQNPTVKKKQNIEVLKFLLSRTSCQWIYKPRLIFGNGMWCNFLSLFFFFVLLFELTSNRKADRQQPTTKPTPLYILYF